MKVNDESVSKSRNEKIRQTSSKGSFNTREVIRTEQEWHMIGVLVEQSGPGEVDRAIIVKLGVAPFI